MSHAGRTTTDFMTTENPIQPQTKPEPQAPALALGHRSAFFTLYKDGWTGGLQLAIEDSTGSGFRIAGPKFNGSGKALQKHEISERDAKEIRSYLDHAFPPNNRVRLPLL